MHFILLYLTFDVDCIQTTTTCILTTQNVIVNPRFVRKSQTPGRSWFECKSVAGECLHLGLSEIFFSSFLHSVVSLNEWMTWINKSAVSFEGASNSSGHDRGPWHRKAQSERIYAAEDTKAWLVNRKTINCSSIVPRLPRILGIHSFKMRLCQNINVGGLLTSDDSTFTTTTINQMRRNGKIVSTSYERKRAGNQLTLRCTKW